MTVTLIKSDLEYPVRRQICEEIEKPHLCTCEVKRTQRYISDEYGLSV